MYVAATFLRRRLRGALIHGLARPPTSYRSYYGPQSRFTSTDSQALFTDVTSWGRALVVVLPAQTGLD